MSTLELHDISKSFNGERILQHVDLSVPPGGRTAIVGPSGSGKTTLLRLIAGFEKPDAGRIIMHGCTLVDDGVHVPAHRRDIGFVPQDGALFPHVNVAGNIGFGLSGGRRDKKRRVEELMAMVALDPRLASLWPHELSGGQQQRVALARALSQQPRLMLLDEPFSALDTGLRAATRKAVMALLADAGVAAILVTHDQNEALSFADRLAVMHNGRLTQVGKPVDVYLRPVDEPTALFLGETLIFSALVGGGRADCALGNIAVDNDAFSGPARVMLRPEQIRVAPSVPQDACRATIVAVDFAGFVSTLTLRLSPEGQVPGNLLEITTLSQDGLRPGGTVALRIVGPAHVFTT